MSRLRLIRDPRNQVIATMDLDANEMKVFRGATPEYMMRGVGGYAVWQFAEREAQAGRNTLISRFRTLADEAPLSVKYEVAGKYSDISPDTIIGETFTYASGYSDSEALEELLASADGLSWYNRYWQAIKDGWIGLAAERGMYLGDKFEIEEMAPHDFVSHLIQMDQEQDDSE